MAIALPECVCFQGKHGKAEKPGNTEDEDNEQNLTDTARQYLLLHASFYLSVCYNFDVISLG